MVSPLWSETYLLKEFLAYTGPTLNASDMLPDYKGPSLQIPALPDGWHSVHEISQLIKTCGMEDFALYGKGIRLLQFEGSLSPEGLTALLTNRYPQFPVSAWSSLQQMSGPLLYRNLRSDRAQDKITVSLEILPSGMTEPIRIEESGIAETPSSEPSLGNLPVSSEWTLILKTQRTAELVLQKGTIEIRLPVRIRQQMGPEEYLVENTASGKAFRVRNPLSENTNTSRQ